MLISTAQIVVQRWLNSKDKKMSKEKQIQDSKSKQLIIDELLKFPPMVIETALLYALNYTSYGADVTEKVIMMLWSAKRMIALLFQL